jgi:hypothetical protein
MELDDCGVCTHARLRLWFILAGRTGVPMSSCVWKLMLAAEKLLFGGRKMWLAQIVRAGRTFMQRVESDGGDISY